MSEYTSKLGNDGRVVIPAVFRERYHLHSGDRLVFRPTETGLEISTFEQAFAEAKSFVKKKSKGRSLVKILRDLRNAEFDDE